jgi:hypothetical protein
MMSERIRKLATEVGISVEYLSNTKQIVLLEKFAELLIRECADLVDNNDDSYPYVSFGDMIKKHFGVDIDE